MVTTPTGIAPGRKLTGAEFTDLQAGTRRHVVFSLTDACPLQCAHCWVTASARARQAMSPGMASYHASQFAALRQCGVDKITLTGGEPLLMPAIAGLLSEAAAAQGITTTIVTACHWADSDGASRDTVLRLAHVGSWHLSTDVYHAAFIPAEQVARAACAAFALGRQVVVRMAAAPADYDSHALLFDRVRKLLPAEVPIHVQSVVGAGERRTEMDEKPRYCVPGGLLVRQDGSFAPCCGLLSDERRAHPFAPPLEGSSLVAAIEQWRSDPLQQLVQTIGFWPVLDWAREVDESAFEDARCMAHTCDCCVRLWQSHAVRVHVRRQVMRPSIREKVAALYHATIAQPCGAAPHESVSE
jgi:pyruvate-formate lyase-activating enzyme